MSENLLNVPRTKPDLIKRFELWWWTATNDYINIYSLNRNNI